MNYVSSVYSIKYLLYQYIEGFHTFLFVCLFLVFFGHAMQLARSQFLDQGLSPGHGSESAVSQPLDHQGTPTFSLFKHLYSIPLC